MSHRPKLSVVLNFFNMRREAPRTLHSLSAAYQRFLRAEDYEVIAIDNGSSEPLSETEVRAHGPGFRYHYHRTTSPSPVEAVHQGVCLAAGEFLTVIIDGAHVLTPGVLGYSLWLAERFENPFVTTLGFHLGPAMQNISQQSGYNQAAEDELLEACKWQENGYGLFGICAPSDGGCGWLGPQYESSCFTLRTELWHRLGGLDRRFQSRGGGLASLDLYQRVMESPKLDFCTLLGEATFHQYHGGVSTNAPPDRHPWKEFNEEYERIRGKPFALVYRAPLYFGNVPREALDLFSRSVADSSAFWQRQDFCQ